ncbi:hypothetical protein [Puia dinghuensis]|uniref:Uncharacterized protein n=1 Tax=Puia dinghuensis TaxID=1792502 RepID=A0A8J2UCS8_9BACT|nr:hypothetical protein [Puia dinghuensis]GGA97894.1 hypothetical protein GCM10011511_21530 [Puia dinghuensis]
MNQSTILTFFLSALIGTSATIVKAQNTTRDSLQDSYHIYFPAQGKEILAGHLDGHSYKLVSVYNKATDLYVDNRQIDKKDWSKYDAIVERLKTTITDDEAEEARDMAQAQRDREQADRDREQGERDREQAEHDRVQGDHDREQAEHDREQGARDREQASRDREQAQQDREQASRDRDQAEGDREQAERDRAQAAEDRAMLRQLIDYLVDQKIVPNAQSLTSLVLTDTTLTVNGTIQSQDIFKAVKDKFGSWARHGLSYGCTPASGSYIHLSPRTQSVSTNNSGNYSLTIND